MAAVGAMIGLWPKNIIKALSIFSQLKQIEQSQPDLLSDPQKKVIARFEKQLKDPAILGLVKNLQLKGILNEQVALAINTNSQIVWRIGESKAKKLFTRYIKLKRNEALFDKTIKEMKKVQSTGIKSLATKLKIKWNKRQIAKLENSNPDIKKTLANAVKIYTEHADKVMEELAENLIHAAKTTKFQQELKKLQRKVIPLKSF